MDLQIPTEVRQVNTEISQAYFKVKSSNAESGGELLSKECRGKKIYTRLHGAFSRCVDVTDVLAVRMFHY